MDGNKDYILECCVDSVESAVAAAEGGADRLELCAALIIGGTSPSIALFEQVRHSCDLPIRVLLRPRFGDFLYTDHEFEIIRREVELFKNAGADGVVIGCLAPDGSLDMAQMARLIETAGMLKITLHRAFDVCADPIQAYKQAAELEIDTILTSGQEKDCLTGLPLLKELCNLQQKLNGPKIMAGAGVNPNVIRRFLTDTEIKSYHLSAKKIIDSGMQYRKAGVPMGLPALSEYAIYRTDRAIVAEAKSVLTAHQAAENNHMKNS